MSSADKISTSSSRDSSDDESRAPSVLDKDCQEPVITPQKDKTGGDKNKKTGQSNKTNDSSSDEDDPTDDEASPVSEVDLKSCMSRDGLLTAVRDSLDIATDKNIVALEDMLLTALKTQSQADRHKLANDLLRAERNMDASADPAKTRRDTRVFHQILFGFWMDFLHEKASTKQKASTSVTGDFNRIRGIDLMSKKVHDDLRSPSELNDFIKSVRIKTQTFPIWHKLMKIKVKGKTNKRTVTYNLLKDHRKLDNTLVTGYDFESTQELKDGSLSLYQALSASISQRLRTMMVTHEDEIGLSGPKFLFFILRTLTDEITTLSREVNEYVLSLPETLKANSYDIPTIAPYLQTQLVALRNAGGNLASMYDHIKSAFMDLNINKLTSKLTSFGFKMDQITLDEGDLKGTRAILLLKQAPQMVKEVRAMKKWKWSIPTKAVGNTTSKSSDSKHDLTAFKALKSEVLSEVKALYSTTGKTPFNGNKTRKKRRSEDPYAFGPQLWSTTNPNLVNNQEEFIKFRAGDYGKQKISYNGADWRWCEKCGRMGNHSTDRHRDKPDQSKRSKRVTVSSEIPSCFAQNAKLDSLPVPSKSDTEGGTDIDTYDASDLDN